MRTEVAVLLGAALLLPGCGYVGEPLPPLANIPARVTGMVVVQRGTNLVVEFAVPVLTTEGTVMRRAPTLDLRAGTAGEPFDPGQWAGAAAHPKPVAVENGHARYEIPASQWAGHEVIVAARTIGANGKDAGWSDFVVVPVVNAPPRPENVHPESAPAGVRLTWQAAGASFRVYKREGDAPLALAATVSAAEWVDADASIGKSYGYVVQTLLAVGSRTAESEPSAEARITPEDKFPPAVPAGLQASPSPVSIELGWDQNQEPDLAGYRIYRSVAGSEMEQIGETSGVPSFSDRKVSAGQTFQYAVTAFDRAGNESARSAPVTASVP